MAEGKEALFCLRAWKGVVRQADISILAHTCCVNFNSDLKNHQLVYEEECAEEGGASRKMQICFASVVDMCPPRWQFFYMSCPRGYTVFTNIIFINQKKTWEFLQLLFLTPVSENERFFFFSFGETELFFV